VSRQFSPDAKKGMQARNSAVKQLIAEHMSEYERILGDQREARGLSRDPKAHGKDIARQKRIERLRRQLAELEAQS